MNDTNETDEVQMVHEAMGFRMRGEQTHTLHCSKGSCRLVAEMAQEILQVTH
jgi:hypothetical protein